MGVFFEHSMYCVLYYWSIGPVYLRGLDWMMYLYVLAVGFRLLVLDLCARALTNLVFLTEKKIGSRSLI